MPDHPRAEAGESGFGRSSVAVATDGVESLKVVFCSERSARMKRFVQVVLVASLAFLGSTPSWAHYSSAAAASGSVGSTWAPIRMPESLRRATDKTLDGSATEQGYGRVVQRRSDPGVTLLTGVSLPRMALRDRAAQCGTRR